MEERSARDEDGLKVEVRALVKQQIKDCYNLYLQKVENDLVTNPNHCWFFIQSKKGSSSIPDNDLYQHPVVNTQHDCFHLGNLTDEDILKALFKLPNKLIAGEDLVTSFVVRDAADIFVMPLKKIFNYSLSTATCALFLSWGP
ncbi:unnamed protein product [Acanthoscelides obtectus]|uniref:Uncharacterized protein n=1 Tax=Acanthoscelides obtectus TaxID=200917 RepID=A0A9P0M0U3_ACAOB|nr:unnamed protein product [Acanthoscelides obtectus]CAK1630019.1 hypothetical protein AOBTE_LOCUS6105 [Acanthoscelides obtectus]